MPKPPTPSEGRERRGRPSDLMATLAAATLRRTTDDWFVADEMRHRLRMLGFNVSAQQVAAQLRRLCEMDAPPVESKRESYWPTKDYRVTRFGRTWIENEFPPLRVAR